MANEIDGIVQGLRSADDVTQAFAAVDRLNRESRTRDLLDLWAAIEKASEAGTDRSRHEAVADHVEEVLALTAGSDHVEALCELLARDRVRSVQRPRSQETRVRALASRLGHGQTKDALLGALGRAARDASTNANAKAAAASTRELLACWVQEVVLHDVALDGEPAAVAFQESLVAAGHPLASLPLRLLETEAEGPSYMPMYGADAIWRAAERLEAQPVSMHSMPPPGDGAPPSLTRVPDAELERRLGVAIEPWLGERSNGESQAALFRSSAPLGSAPGRWLLRALTMEAVGDVEKLTVARCSAVSPWGMLFSAATNGGAYSSGLGGAYGRRAAWTSLGALVGAADEGVLPRAIEELARRAKFLTFRGDNGWFADVAWDVGIVAVRPGGETVAVLAATDTD